MAEATLVKQAAWHHEHWHNLKEGLLEKSEVAQHAYEEGHRIVQDEVRILEITADIGNTRNSSKDQTMLEKSLDELESIHIEDEVKNVLVTIINLVINSGDAKAMAGHL
jgi:hypothetical protein